ncbi:unnamed protein product, partial [Closterium sp. NIES-54]
ALDACGPQAVRWLRLDPPHVRRCDERSRQRPRVLHSCSWSWRSGDGFGGGGGGGGNGGGGGRGGGGGGGGDGGGAGRGGAVQRGPQQQQRSRGTPSPQQLREWYAGRQGSGGAGPCTYVLRTGDRTGEQCGGLHATQLCFGRLTDAWCAQFPDATEIPRWHDLHRSGVAIFDLDFDAILATMYAVSISAEGDCYVCVPPDPGIEAAALGTSESAAPGTRESAPLGAGESALSGPESAPCSCRLLSHQTLLWHHRLGHPSLPRLRGMASRVLVSGLPRSLPPLPPGPAPTCVPCVEERQRAAPHSSEFPPTEAPLQTLHMDVWGQPRVCGQGHERYFLLVVDDYSRHTTVFPLRSKGEVTEVLIDWISVARLQLRERFDSDFPVLRLHSDRGGEFSSDLLRAFCRAEGIRQTFTLPASPQQNEIAERRIGMVMDVARTSMIHAAAPHFLLPFALLFETCLRTSCPPVLFLASSSAFPLTRLGPAPSGVSQVDAVEPVEVAADSGASGGAEPGGAESGGAEPKRAVSWGAEPERAELEGAASRGAEPRATGRGGVEPAGAGPGGPSGALSRRELPSLQVLREWFARRWSRAARAGGAAAAGGSAAPGGTRASGTPGAGTGGSPSAEGAGATGPGGARTGGSRAAGPASAPSAGASGAAGVGTAGGTEAGVGVSAGGPAGAGAAGGTGARGAAGVGADAWGTGVVPAGPVGAERPRSYFVPLLEHVLGIPTSPSPAPSLACPLPVQSESHLQLASPLPTPSPYAGPTGGLAERREPESRPASPVRTARTSRRVPRPRPPTVLPVRHSVSLCRLLPSPLFLPLLTRRLTPFVLPVLLSRVSLPLWSLTLLLSPLLRLP